MVTLLWLWLAACEDDACPRGSMLASAGGLTVTEEEHPTGWGDARCFACHAEPGIHRAGCTPEVDLGALGGLEEADCAGCHGDNGVAP